MKKQLTTVSKNINNLYTSDYEKIKSIKKPEWENILKSKSINIFIVCSPYNLYIYNNQYYSEYSFF